MGDIPVFWSAGSGKGWPADDVVEMLREKFGFPDRPGYLWQWGEPFMVNRDGPRPFIVTCDDKKAQLVLLAGEDVAFLPNLMPPPIEPPSGYAEKYCSTGDPWLQGVS